MTEKTIVDEFIDNIADDEPTADDNKFTAATLVIDPVPPINGIAIVDRPQIPRNKLSPKQRLIIDAMELYPDKSKAELAKMKVADLKELIANKKLIDDTAKISHKSREELENMNAEDLKKELGETVNANLQSMIKREPINLPTIGTEDIRANTLYNFHRVAAGIIECVSESEAIVVRTGSNLAGLSQDLRDDKDEFLAILKDLYREHHEEIDMYITPLTVYGMFMMEKVQARYMENKKKISRGESVKSPLKLESLLGLSSSCAPAQSSSQSEFTKD